MERFVKYQALGNDFVVVDRRDTGVDLTPKEAIAWCDRHFGIGADGVLALLPSTQGMARMVVHNADGSVAEMCGNGLRCVVKHLAEVAKVRPEVVPVETGAGLLRSEVTYGAGGVVDRIVVDLGRAHLAAPHLPRGPEGGPFTSQPIEGRLGTAVSMGNPHLVLLDAAPELAVTLGPVLERHPLFPERTNVECCALDGAGGLKVTVWERGVGLTLACGTGAAASVVAWALAGRLPFDAWVPVTLPGGQLEVKVAGDLSHAWLKGSAARVFEGHHR